MVMEIKPCFIRKTKKVLIFIRTFFITIIMYYLLDIAASTEAESLL